MANSISRGEIFFVSLDPVRGHEMGGNKKRPVVVISINAIHQKTGIAAVVPGTTTAPKSQFPNVIEVLPDAHNNLTNVTYFQCHQIRAIDESRMSATPAGRLSGRDLSRLEAAVWRVLGWVPPTKPFVPPPP
jgi:mRNA-degrading endonuclease toxin of MazEF toxin-antitoxin module